MLSVPTGLYNGVGIKSNCAKMAGFELIEHRSLGLGRLVGLYLKAVKSQKLIVAKLGMRQENIVIGVGYNRIAKREIKLLDLLGAEVTVGKVGVTVEICLIEISTLGK